ncbi:hypothetical protein GCM10010409_31070 [Mycolicibacterium diernhoferi]|nr:hypothetical protein BRW64_02480 [Mycolicibacterium diernhoferi]
MLGAAKTDVLAFTAFTRAHWQKIWSINPIERLNKEIKRRADGVEIFPNPAAFLQLETAVVIEAHDEWQITRRYLSDVSMDELRAVIEKKHAAVATCQTKSNRLAFNMIRVIVMRGPRQIRSPPLPGTLSSHTVKRCRMGQQGVRYSPITVGGSSDGRPGVAKCNARRRSSANGYSPGSSIPGDGISDSVTRAPQRGRPRDIPIHPAEVFKF